MLGNGWSVWPDRHRRPHQTCRRRFLARLSRRPLLDVRLRVSPKSFYRLFTASGAYASGRRTGSAIQSRSNQLSLGTPSPRLPAMRAAKSGMSG